MDQRSYYTLHLVAHFSLPFQATGTWPDSMVQPDTSEVHGGTTYGSKGYPPHDKGSGTRVVLDTPKSSILNARVGISYISEQNAEANLRAEHLEGTAFNAVRARAHSSRSNALGRIRITASVQFV